MSSRRLTSILARASAPIGMSLLASCSSSATGSADAGTVLPTDAGVVNDTGTTPVPDATPELQIRPALTFTGVDGTHTFRVPVAVYGAGRDLKLVPSDPSLATLEPASLGNPDGDDGTYFIITARKAGTLTLSALSGGARADSTLTISSYSAGRYATGEARYKTGVPAKQEPPCTKCHNTAGIDHSPASVASVSDEEVGVIITTGILNGIPISSDPRHQWTVTLEERDGLVTFLRGLPPRGFK